MHKVTRNLLKTRSILALVCLSASPDEEGIKTAYCFRFGQRLA